MTEDPTLEVLQKAFRSAITLRRSAEQTANQYDMNGLTRSIQADTLADIAEIVAYLVAEYIGHFMPDIVKVLKADLADEKARFASQRQQFMSTNFPRFWPDA